MTRHSTPLILLLSLLGCQPVSPVSGSEGGNENPERKDSTEVNPPAPKERELLAPGNLELSYRDGTVYLTWTDESTKEEGYEVIRSRQGDSGEVNFYLKSNSTSWSEPSPGSGIFTYSVRAFWHTDRGQEASIQFFNQSKPEVVLEDVQSSHWAIGAKVLLKDDGGQKCRTGISIDGTELDTILECSKGDSHYMLAEWLESSHTYKLRAWAENDAGKSWSEELDVTTAAAPSALKVQWTDISAANGMPEGTALYSAVSSVTGSKVNIWHSTLVKGCAAHLSTTLASELTRPGDYIRSTLSKSGEVLVTTNGGYFGAPNTSYSLVIDGGVRKSKNIGVLSRSGSYYITRGAFGVMQDGTPQLRWIWDESTYVNAYNRPLPVIDGEPSLKVSLSFPDAAHRWEPVSAIGGAPVLIKDGVICFDYMKTADGKYLTNHELLQSDIYKEGLKAPRTAIGCRADGTVVLLVCDGRGSGGSAGLTLDELARVMAGLGCTDALNLDGGGSSQILSGSNGTLLNNPSDGEQRKVLSFVAFVK